MNRARGKSGLQGRPALGLSDALPASLDAERAVMGAVMLDNAAYSHAAELLRPDDFSNDGHRRIFARMTVLGESGRPIDPVTLTEELLRTGELEAVGGVAFLSSLTEGLPRSSNVAHYTRIVKDKAVLRRQILIFEGLRRQAAEPSALPIEIHAYAEAALARLGEGFDGTGTRIPLFALAVEELLTREIKPREMLLEPILPEQGLVMIYAKRGDGKTYIALGMAVAVASGGTFLRWKAPRPRRVLYVDGELPAKTLQERAAMIIAGADVEPEPGMLRLITPDLQERPMPDLATVEGQALIEPHLAGVDLVVLDNLSALCRYGKENESESWLPVQAWALTLRRRGISVLFVHHAGKSGAQRGTSRREDLLDTVLTLKRPPDYSPEEGLRCEIYFEKTRAMFGDGAKPFEVKLETGTGGAAVWAMRDLENVQARRVGEMVNDGMSLREIAEELGVSKSKVARLRDKHRDNGATVPLSQPLAVGQRDTKTNGGQRAGRQQS